ncbi:2-hydroxyacid dehydrogenase [Flavimaricola marinus]|uniref:Glyoxylate/hydroxypyruvate reductase B n=1 Tax=Flavimaricola marinus TaxID=1819565 RepID=A0A238LJ07_9RHOB|nr:2-hydroxyacid dehydrogenase [Flavimaricola marinus]SMY09394.1 Glyoxylate/hydroxypyruvate reductase B [Flavimaricola marinus]
MTRIEILQMGPFPEWDQTPLDAAYRMHRYFEAADPAALLAEVGPRVQAIATRGSIGAGADVIAACPDLRLVAVYGVGYDAVDLSACRDRGIRLTNTPDVLTGDVADLGVAMMLAQARGIVAADGFVRSGEWTRTAAPLTRRVHGGRAGILGMGRIGRAVAERLAGFQMQIAYSDLAPVDLPGATFIADPVDLAKTVDVLFVTLAASAATRGIVGADVLAALGPDGLLVNISRASNVDEPALLAALESGTLGAAALDVFDGEPRIDPRFLALDNVLLQPHHASATHQTRRDMGQLMRDNIDAFFAGRPLPSMVI